MMWGVKLYNYFDGQSKLSKAVAYLLMFLLVRAIFAWTDKAGSKVCDLPTYVNLKQLLCAATQHQASNVPYLLMPCIQASHCRNSLLPTSLLQASLLGKTKLLLQSLVCFHSLCYILRSQKVSLLSVLFSLFLLLTM